MDSVTITTTLDGRVLQRGLSRLPALRAPEEAWCELAEALRVLDADQLIAAAEAIVASDWHAGAPCAACDCDTDGTCVWFTLADETSVSLRVNHEKVDVTFSSPYDDARYLADRFREATEVLELADSERLCREFLWRLLSRVNPAYAPRRRAATAEKWAAVAAHICEYLRESRPKQALVFWACGELLDTASWIDRPPGYEYLGYGSLRRQAQDAGGIEGQALMELARAVLALSQGGAGTVSDEDWQAWATLFPGTASLAWHKPSDTRLRRIVQAEWELVYGRPSGWGADEIRPLTKEVGDQVIE
jgi:hypothetical protein